jgi:NAD(P)-dependent dehydrogenase (short-subunit alcohol dehydrogenase family)
VVSTSEQVWNQVMGVTLTGVFLCSKYAIPERLKRGGGPIVNVASVAGLAGLRDGASYNASKGGVVLLTKNMALDFADKGIRVNCVCPGATVTPMYEAGIALNPDPEAVRARMTALRPMQRLGNPDEIARAVLFLASSASSYITGDVLVVDGGVMAQFPGQIRPGT